MSEPGQNFSLSVVIAVFNDEEVLSELYRRLKAVLSDEFPTHEIVFVDDGSSDDSYRVLKELQSSDETVKVVKLTRCFGQSSAIAAGLDYSGGDVIVIMDSDLQDPPEDIPKLIDAMIRNDVSMAIARWVTRKDSIPRKLASWLIYHTSQRLTDLKYEPGLGIFRVLRREILDELKLLPEKTGTSLSLLFWMGFDYVPVELHRDSRYAGKSGYNLNKMIKLSFDRIFSYSLFPTRVALAIGIVLGLAGLTGAIVFGYRQLFMESVSTNLAWFAMLVLFLIGVGFVMIGIIGEYIGRIYNEVRGRPKYITDRYKSLKLATHEKTRRQESE